MRFTHTIALAMFAGLLAGCSSPHITLEQRWAPLKTIEQDPTKMISPGVITTLGETAYVRNVGDFTRDYPEGPFREALLLHEQAHSKRQFAFVGGLPGWVALWLGDRRFRWSEEQIGWRLEIRYLVDHGIWVDDVGTARFLSGDSYKIFGQRMVSFDEALKWVRGVIAGP